MGRHQITSDHVRKDEGHKVELLGWGLFLTAVAAAGMTYIGLPAGIIFLIAAVGLVAFVLFWVFTQLQEDRTAHSFPAARQAAPAPQIVRVPAPPVAPSQPTAVPVIAAATVPPATAPVRPAAPVTQTDAVNQLPPDRRLRRAPATRREARAMGQLGAPYYSNGVRPDGRRTSAVASAAPVARTTPAAAPAAATAAVTPAGFTPRLAARAAVPAERVPAPTVRAARAYEASPAASSWTKTFGAPDTGSIPIQPYTGQGNVATAVRKRGKHQMSHSRL